jgi:hypothetical protein
MGPDVAVALVDVDHQKDAARLSEEQTVAVKRDAAEA